MSDQDEIVIGKIRIAFTDSGDLVIHCKDKKTKPIEIGVPLTKDWCRRLRDGLSKVGYEIPSQFVDKLFDSLTSHVWCYSDDGKWKRKHLCRTCGHIREHEFVMDVENFVVCQCMTCGGGWVRLPEEVDEETESVVVFEEKAFSPSGFKQCLKRARRMMVGVVKLTFRVAKSQYSSRKCNLEPPPSLSKK